jgi:hypothetical protein
MRDRVLLVPTFPPLVLGIVVVVVLIAAATLAVYPGRDREGMGSVLAR